MRGGKLIRGDWCVLKPEKKAKGCIVALPGRGGHGETLAKIYNDVSKKNDAPFLVIGLTPRKFKWYPMPNGASDQREAVNGIERARIAIEETVYRISDKFGFSHDNIALVGFSAGAVMAIQVAVHSIEPYACVVGHSGAILDPPSLPYCHTPTPIILTHNQDDQCFSWEERYLPMKNALIDKRYKLRWIESKEGNHNIWDDSLDVSFHYLMERFGEDYVTKYWELKKKYDSLFSDLQDLREGIQLQHEKAEEMIQEHLNDNSDSETRRHGTGLPPYT